MVRLAGMKWDTVAARRSAACVPKEEMDHESPTTLAVDGGGGLGAVLASSGTTLAASRYLVTSTSQIKPSVLRSLASTARGEINEVHTTSFTASKGETRLRVHVLCASPTP